MRRRDWNVPTVRVLFPRRAVRASTVPSETGGRPARVPPIPPPGAGPRARRRRVSAAELAPVFGWLATLASVVSFTPQAWKIIRTRQTADISAAMYAVTVTGFALWTVYGALLGQLPLILTNALCLLLSGFILLMKLLPRRGKDAVADAIDPNVRG